VPRATSIPKRSGSVAPARLEFAGEVLDAHTLMHVAPGQAVGEVDEVQAPGSQLTSLLEAAGRLAPERSSRLDERSVTLHPRP
jgi:hypothetical protein